MDERLNELLKMELSDVDVDELEEYLPGWTVEAHEAGLCLCSPGVDARELNYRDDSNETLFNLVPDDVLTDLKIHSLIV